MSKTDTGLHPIGSVLQTADRHYLLVRTWRVVNHTYFVHLRRVVEMVVLEATEPIAREEIPRI